MVLGRSEGGASIARTVPPSTFVKEQPVPAGDEQRADEHGVDGDADHQGEAELAERAQRAEQERGEAARRDRRGRRDQAAGLADRPDDPRRGGRSGSVSSCSRVIRKTL